VVIAVTVLSAIAAASAAADQVIFTGQPGTGAPPAKLGSYFMERFGPDPQPLAATTSTVASPIGPLGFEPAVEHLRVNEGWGTWSNGYGGDVYYSSAQEVKLVMPPHTKAFYFYGEPQGFGPYSVTASTSEGTSSGAVPVQGFGGAIYFGFYDAGESFLSSITVVSFAPSGFALGEFGISAGAPVVSCEGNDSSWHAANVSVKCTSWDPGGSGLAHPGEEASFQLSTAVAEGSETANAYTNSRQICDAVDNCVEAGPIGPFKVDRKAPVIAISSPQENAEIPHGAIVHAEFTCTDGGSGVAKCEGSTGAGEQLPTDTAGPHSLYVSSRDAVGNESSAKVHYVVLPAPPAVTDEGVASLAASSATLQASVNPNGGLVSSCLFEYGTSTAYGQTAPCSTMPGSGASPVAVSAAVADLSPNTTYHFRVVATNAGGTGEGGDQTFTTSPNPPTVVMVSASLVTATSATLNATVNPNGGLVRECRVEYGPTTAYGQTESCSPSSPGSGTSAVSVSAAVTDLSPNTTYHYRFVASNAGGETKAGDRTFTTSPNAPSVTTGNAAPVGQTTATLHATVDPEGAEVSDCHFEYGATTEYGHTEPCSPSPGSGTSAVPVSAAVTDLSPNTTYHYRIVATNAGGTNKGSDETLSTPPNPPTVSTGSPSSITATSATLNATVNPNGGLVTECRLEYGLTTSYGHSESCSPSPGFGTSAVSVSAAVTGLSPNTTYHYRIVATNAGGKSEGTDQMFTTLPPGPPAVRTGEATQIGRASATLNATVDPEGANVTDCHFEYGATTAYGHSATCSPSPGSGTVAVRVSAVATGLSPSAPYHFRVVATNAGGKSEGTDQTLTTLPPVPPTVATESASLITASAATLGGSVDPNELTVTDCQFEYGPTSSYGSTALCTPSPGSGAAAVAVSAHMTGLSANTTYHYRIAATNAAGTSYGSDLTFSTPKVPELETGTCVKLARATGRYRDPGCTEPSAGEDTGTYEWQPWPLANDSFHFKSGPATLKSAAKRTMACSNNTLAGEYTGPKTATATITLTGCKGTRSVSGTCASEGAAAGELRLNPLHAQLGVIKAGATPTIGWSFAPASGASLVAFRCGATNLAVTGSVIAQVTGGSVNFPVGKMFSSFTLKFTASKGHQKTEEFEDGIPHALALLTESHEEEPAGLQMKSVIASGESVEIRAVG
jgi:phosphodiesterase/alkaline phosphatase D-like protein